jgi:xylulose-5-phosphate/fructose-6-phosphate phosphoketolase
MAATMDTIVERIKAIKAVGDTDCPRWPMLVLRTPKGWTGPKMVDGKPCEGTWRSHQVPIAKVDTPEHLGLLEEWMQSYRHEELFDETGRLRPELEALAPKGERRMSANPHANGGQLLKELAVPDFRKYAVPVEKPGTQTAESVRSLGCLLRDLLTANEKERNFRIFGPDETSSNRLDAVFDVTQKVWMERIDDGDNQLARDGRVVEILSEHNCQGWLEGYLLTGRHGLFSCYEAFIHIIDSMFNQHAKWLKVTRKLHWRKPIASLTYLLTSHVWRQDHNGFSHQDPGFIDHVVNKKAEIVRVYLPPDANSKNYINVIVAGKQPQLQFLDIDAAIKHCTAGIGIWDWASNDQGGDPDVVMACAGDIPTLETLAAVAILREKCPDLKVRVINIVDLMVLEPPTEHPHGMSDADFDTLFTTDKPVVLCYHGYPWLIHRLTYRRKNHNNIHVRGYKEEGTTTTPFDMCVLNEIDRFHLVLDVIERVPSLGYHAAYTQQWVRDRLTEHHAYIREHGDDMPDVRNWVWPY